MGNTGSIMVTTARGAHGLDSVHDLVARFDPGDMDVPGGRARIRINAGAAGIADALVEGGIVRLVPVAGEPDAELGVWSEISRDVRAGMAAYKADRLRIRRNLHLGVGFLAATSGDTDPKRL